MTLEDLIEATLAKRDSYYGLLPWRAARDAVNEVFWANAPELIEDLPGLQEAFIPTRFNVDDLARRIKDGVSKRLTALEHEEFERHMLGED